MRLARGWPWFVLPPLILGLVALVLSAVQRWALAAGVVLVVLAGLVAWFFRDPDRVVGSGIVAAADGRIQDASPTGIVTFLNVHDVHVVRAPYEGRVTAVRRFTGPRKPAFLDGAKHNAGVAIELETRWGVHELRLVAGLVARRAVAWVDTGDTVDKGERVGMIRFGSRVDVELPPESIPRVEPGEKAHAGETTIAAPPEDSDAAGREGPA